MRLSRARPGIEGFVVEGVEGDAVLWVEAVLRGRVPRNAQGKSREATIIGPKA